MHRRCRRRVDTSDRCLRMRSDLAAGMARVRRRQRRARSMLRSSPPLLFNHHLVHFSLTGHILGLNPIVITGSVPRFSSHPAGAPLHGTTSTLTSSAPFEPERGGGRLCRTAGHHGQQTTFQILDTIASDGGGSDEEDEYWTVHNCGGYGWGDCAAFKWQLWFTRRARAGP